MRAIWLIFSGLVAALLGVFGWQRQGAAPPAATTRSATVRTPAARLAARPTTRPVAPPRPAANAPSTVIPFRAGPAATSPRRDSVVRSALQLLGTSYCYAGTTPAGGFDCSGFVQYVFGRHGVAVPHSTALLIDVGRPVPRAAARPGDLVVFTGTAKTSTTPGHAGIVVSAGPGEPLRFVHSSSARRESGVKVSQVEGSDYERRFMQVRRVLPE